MSFRAFLWLIVAIGMIVIELMTMGLTTVWFAGGALCAMGMEMLKLPMIAQLLGFAVISVVLFLITRPMAMKYINTEREHTNADRLVGETAIVTEEIRNVEAAGQVRIEGQVWTARTERDDQIARKGDKVTVRGISGVKLIVEPSDSIRR